MPPFPLPRCWRSIHAFSQVTYIQLPPFKKFHYIPHTQHHRHSTSLTEYRNSSAGLALCSFHLGISLGTGVCLIPERNPLLLAKVVATLDHFSRGRFLFGIGAGWHREETEIMGGNFSHRWSQTHDAILAMKELWTKEEAEYHGKYYDFPPVKSFPKPFQKPHPPILLGGIARNVFKRTLDWGDGWMPSGSSPEQVKQGRDTLNHLAVRSGRDPRSIQVLAYNAPTNREAFKGL